MERTRMIVLAVRRQGTDSPRVKPATAGIVRRSVTLMPPPNELKAC